MRNLLSFALIAGMLFSVVAEKSVGQSRDSGFLNPDKSEHRWHLFFQRKLAYDYVSLVKNLRGAGLKVKRSGKVSQPFFSATGRNLLVSGEQVQVYEFKTKALADKEAGHVTANGSTVGTTMIRWVAPPHFYKSSRLIVLYVGENVKITGALENALGRQFAGK